MEQTLSHPTLMFVTLLYVLGVSRITNSQETDLRADCSGAGRHDKEVTVCRCDTSKDINCGHGTHVIVTDIIVGTLHVEEHCQSSGVCSTSIDCEYTMSDHCDDKQFLEILEPCNGRQSCRVNNSVSRNITCKGVIAIADYTTVQYRCATNTVLRDIDVCGEGQGQQKQEKHAYLISPSFQDADFKNKSRLCCCNITGVEDFSLLHYDTRQSTGPRIQFGKLTTSGLQTVDFDNKLANVHINTDASDMYFLTWQQDRKSNSGVFLAFLMTRGHNNVSVTCGTTGCPQLPNSTTRYSTSKYDVTASLSKTGPGYSTPTAGNTATTAQTGEHADDDSDDKSPIAKYAGIAGGVVALIIAIVIIVFLVRRRQKETRRTDEPDDVYTEPTKRGDGSNAFTSPNDYELQQPPVPTKPPNITDTEDDYAYVETRDTVPQSASTADATKKPLISKALQGAYQICDDPDSKAHQILDDDESSNCIEQGTAANQSDPAYQEYDATYEVSNTGGDSAPYQEYDASEPGEEYSYADSYRPTKIIQQVQDNPPALGRDYQTRSSYGYATVDDE